MSSTKYLRVESRWCWGRVAVKPSAAMELPTINSATVAAARRILGRCDERSSLDPLLEQGMISIEGV